MRPGRAADHSPPSSAAVMEEESYNSTQPLGHTGPVTRSLYLLPSYNVTPPLYAFVERTKTILIFFFSIRYCYVMTKI